LIINQLFVLEFQNLTLSNFGAKMTNFCLFFVSFSRL